MTIEEMVKKDFEEFILLDPFVPDDLRKSLRMKERLPKFLDNLTAELVNCEAAGIKLTRERIKTLVYSLAKNFVHLLKVQADEMRMSDLAKSLKRTQIEGDELIKKFDKDGNADLSDELGVIITDKGSDDGRGKTN